MDKVDKVAIIGIGCRFPGASDNPVRFWELLTQARNAVGDIPEERWQMNRFYNDNDEACAKSYVRKGHFIDWDYKTFDAGFFNFAPREVEYFDPQQRVLLEVAWEAMENAGIDPTTLAGREVGVYAGGFTLDHMLNQLGSGGRSAIGAHSAAGATLTMLSNRISYAFDFRGPSLSVDTACSSSLVAFSYAVRDILNGSCEMCLVGGVNIMLRPEYPIAMSKGQFLARDGRSKSFDASGDGYGRGEGAGVVVLKGLKQAIDDRDHVLAVVDAAGVNQDGRTNGITVPNGDSQETLMRQLSRQAGIDPASVQYVEAHGTGTPVGDPIEAAAISRVYGQDRATHCRIGSVKSNIGHLEAAAGIAGVIKACLMLANNQVPPLATLECPNPAIPFGENGLALADSLGALAPEGVTRRIAINSFGYGGTNAHAILSRPVEIERLESCKTADRRNSFKLLPLSASDETALQTLAAESAAVLREQNDTLEDILYSFSQRRAHLSHRIGVFGENREQLAQQLDAFAEKGAAERVAQGTRSYKGDQRAVFVYTGMGPQWWGMGQSLYRDNPVFRAAVDEADAIFKEISGYSIRDEMMKTEQDSCIHLTRLAQPANFVLQYALTQALRAEGMIPEAVVGHSVGEIASAWASGVLSLRDALSVSFHRSRIQAKAAGQGGMLAVGLGFKDVQQVLSGHEHAVSIAAVNSASSITLAGKQSHLDRIQKQLESQEIFARPLSVEVPYHSPMMAPLLPELKRALAGLQPKAPTLPLYSTVTGARVDGHGYDAEYWSRNVREPVLFERAIGALLDDDYCLFVEIGPHPVLRNALKTIFKDHDSEARSMQTLNRRAPETDSFRRSLADLFAQGGELDWTLRHPFGRLASLPNYPWQRQQLWRESERQRHDRMTDIEQPLLGMRELNTQLWRADLADHRLDYLRQHVVDGMPVMPAAAYLATMLEAAKSHHGNAAHSWRLSDTSIEKVLVLNIGKPLYQELRLHGDGCKMELHSFDDQQPTQRTRHAASRIYPLIGHETQTLDLGALQQQMGTCETSTSVYQSFATISMQYGPLFQPIRTLHLSEERHQVLARLQLPDAFLERTDNYIAHPTLLDGCFQTVLRLLDPGDGAFLPTAIKSLQIYRPLPAQMYCHGVLTSRSERSVECDLTLADNDGTVIARVQGLMCSSLSAQRSEKLYPAGDHWYVWKQEPLTGSRGDAKRWLLLTAPGDTLADSLCLRLSRANDVPAQSLDWDSTELRQILSTSRFHAVAFLASAGSEDPADPTGETAAARLLETLQSLDRRDDNPRFYLITREAFRLSDKDAPPMPAPGSLVGLRRVAYNELGGLQPTTIDIPRLVGDDILDRLVDELVADDGKDEVAIRREGRYFSELAASGVFSESRQVEVLPDDGDRFRLVADASGDTSRLTTAPANRLADQAIEFRIEAMCIEGATAASILRGENTSGQLMSVCAQVSRVGKANAEITVGSRFCGLMPLSFDSHVSVLLHDSALIPIDASVAGPVAASAVTLSAMAYRLAEQAALSQHDRVLVCGTSLGLALADQLRLRDIAVEVFPADIEHWTVAGLDRIIRNHKLTAIAAPLRTWESFFSFDALEEGGTLIDLDQSLTPFTCGPQVGRLVRISPAHELIRNRPGIEASMRTVLARGVADIPNVARFDLHGFLRLSSRDLASIDRLMISYTAPSALSAQAVDDPDIKTDAAYLVSGGCGGLGKETARWLAAQGAGHIVLASRRAGERGGDQAFLDELERCGSKVSARPCDMTDLAQVQALVDEFAHADMPLRGVFHTAGLIDDKPISELSREDLFKVMRPKATGAWHLHVACGQLPLDHFVLFSSISVLVGNSNQANYCAANGFLDALAQFRHAKGMAGLSINWGAIESVGMLSQDAMIGKHLRQIGLDPIAFKTGLNGMERAMARRLPQVCIASDPNWSKWASYETYGGRSARFRTLVEASRRLSGDSVQSRLSNKLAALDGEQRQQVLTGLITEILARELKMPADLIDASRPLDSLGVDSLMATEIRVGLDEILGISVSALELIGDGSVAALAQKGLAQMQFADKATAAA